MSPEEHERIADAVRKAEHRTAGEIYCVVARASSDYFFPAAFIMVVAIVIAGLGVALAIEHWWATLRLSQFVAAQILAVASALALLWLLPALRLALVPRRLRYRTAHANATRQFLARNVHITTARTGVLIFVSLAERYAEIIADAGINNHVPQSVWDDTVRQLTEQAGRDRLADGFVAAVATVGEVLAAHFPVTAEDVNELDDHVVEI